jgi:SSS family solute:Na+ symporter
MITWGSVIYNDILAPFRKTPWSEKRGLLWNRAIVALIGVFLLFYGLLYPLKGDVYAYLMVTGTIYLASISAMLIACCYWRRANSWGAAASIIFGALIPIACLVTEQLQFIPANQIQLWRSYTGIAAFLAAGVAMVIGSLLKPTTASSESDESPGIAGGVP